MVLNHNVLLKGATLLHDDFRFPKGLALLGGNYLKDVLKNYMMLY